MDTKSICTRPIRSELSVPASDLRKIARGLASDADAVFLDLEDSIAPESKDAARANVIAALQSGDWGRHTGVYRINPVSTPWCYRDLIEVIEAAGNQVVRIIVPKVTSANDVAFVDRLVGQLEQASGLNHRVGLEIQIENPAGLHALDSILASSDRISEVTFGQGDFAAAAGMPAVDIGIADEWDEAVPGDRWMLPRQLIVFAAARFGIRAINGSYADFRNSDGFRRYCRMSRALGFAGVWCIHPDQIAIANDVFTPTPAEITRAQAVVDEMDLAKSEGDGALNRSGIMADEATARMARRTLATANSIRKK
jgi:malyl-CoA/(S)-citramalyl-CoA lyase